MARAPRVIHGPRFVDSGSVSPSMTRMPVMMATMPSTAESGSNRWAVMSASDGGVGELSTFAVDGAMVVDGGGRGPGASGTVATGDGAVLNCSRSSSTPNVSPPGVVMMPSATKNEPICVYTSPVWGSTSPTTTSLFGSMSASP